MTNTLAGLEGKLARLVRQSDCLKPKLWVLVLEVGQAIPEETRAKIRPGDQVVIRQYPKGLLGNV